MNWTRFYTGTIIALITLSVVLIGGYTFNLFVSLLSIIALNEFYKFSFFKNEYYKNIIIFLLFSVGFITSFLLIFLISFFEYKYFSLIISLNTIVIALVSIIFLKNEFKTLNLITTQIAGIIYISVMLSFLVTIRNSENGLFWTIMILAVVSSGDIGAYYIGSLFGKHKLAPKISPKKTIEGSIGGVFLNIFVMLVFEKYVHNLFNSNLYCLFFAFSIGILGQIGDLFASQIKRIVGVKDSGNILPGHGGVLDRLDSLLISLPFAYLLKNILN